MYTYLVPIITQNIYFRRKPNYLKFQTAFLNSKLKNYLPINKLNSDHILKIKVENETTIRVVTYLS